MLTVIGTWKILSIYLLSEWIEGERQIHLLEDSVKVRVRWAVWLYFTFKGKKTLGKKCKATLKLFGCVVI